MVVLGIKTVFTPPVPDIQLDSAVREDIFLNGSCTGCRTILILSLHVNTILQFQYVRSGADPAHFPDCIHRYAGCGDHYPGSSSPLF